MSNPTERTYGDFSHAYDVFNDGLFSGDLPTCLITMQRKGKTYGFFAGDRFSTPDGQGKTDEIALNPSHFTRSTEEVLSTLVHEMCHLWQHHFGKPGRRAYHNKEWSAKMQDVGLMPSDTGQVGGKKTGEKMSHVIKHDGRFQEVCGGLVQTGFVIPYVELWDEGEKSGVTSPGGRITKKATTRTKYTCPDCYLNAWAKPNIKLMCGECETHMEAQEEE